MYDKIVRQSAVLGGIPKEYFESSEGSAYLRHLAEVVRRRFGKPSLPTPGDSLAISVDRLKTAALCFDRVYGFPMINDEVPSDIAFYGATEPEVRLAVVSTVLATTDVGRNILKEAREKPLESAPFIMGTPAFRILSDPLKQIRAALSKHSGLHPTILFDSSNAFEGECRPGSQQILLGALEHIPIVDETQLSWDQVTEFRRDKDARLKYVRLLRWIDSELTEKSPKEAQDLIAIKLDDYQWALKKHGLKAAIGTLSSLLDPKFISAASLAIAGGAVVGGGVVGAIAGAGLLVGRAAAKFGAIAVDLADQRRGSNYEIAYIHELQKRVSK